MNALPPRTDDTGKKEQLGATDRRSPFLFFGLVILLSVPFWALGAFTGLQLLPGLPIAALMVIAPALAALILRLREDGRKGVAALLARSFDCRRVRSWVWYLPALLLMPALNLLAVAVSGFAGNPLPAPQITLADVAFLSAMFFIGALLEELGWTGYATDPLQKRWGALPAGLVVGAVWAVYHFVPLLQVDRSVEWMAWWTLGTIAVRVIMVALYNAAGQSVLIVTLFHMAQNVSWQLYPIRGSHYDPQVMGVVFGITAVVVVLIAWRQKNRSISALHR